MFLQKKEKRKTAGIVELIKKYLKSFILREQVMKYI